MFPSRCSPVRTEDYNGNSQDSSSVGRVTNESGTLPPAVVVPAAAVAASIVVSGGDVINL